MSEFHDRFIPGTDANSQHPFFSPDAQWIGYWSQSEQQLKKIPISGAAPVTLCDATVPFAPSWSIDDTIVYVQAEGIMCVSANGGTPEVIVASKGDSFFEPTILPEWKLVLFTTLDGNERKIAVQSIGDDSSSALWIYDLTDDREIRQLTLEGSNCRPLWTPDSKRITFSSDHEGAMSIYWMPADGSMGPERLTTAEDGTRHWPTRLSGLLTQIWTSGLFPRVANQSVSTTVQITSTWELSFLLMRDGSPIRPAPTPAKRMFT